MALLRRTLAEYRIALGEWTLLEAQLLDPRLVSGGGDGLPAGRAAIQLGALAPVLRDRHQPSQKASMQRA